MTGRTNENEVRMTGRSNEKKRPRLLRSIEISANCLAAMTFSHEILTKNVEETAAFTELCQSPQPSRR
jgi:hypothetical protein